MGFHPDEKNIFDFLIYDRRIFLYYIFQNVQAHSNSRIIADCCRRADMLNKHSQQHRIKNSHLSSRN